MCPLAPCQLARAPPQRPGPRGGGMNEAFIPQWTPRLGSQKQAPGHERGAGQPSGGGWIPSRILLNGLFLFSDSWVSGFQAVCLPC